jgi:hypothetical protein
MRIRTIYYHRDQIDDDEIGDTDGLRVRGESHEIWLHITFVILTSCKVGK